MSTENINNKNATEPMPSKSIRLRVDQWETCDRMKDKLELPSPSHFIREAVDFYVEFLNSKNSAKFLTPALESVIGGKIRDSEERINRNLFKLASDMNFLARVVADTYEFSHEFLQKVREQAIRNVRETNGTIRVDDIIRGK